MELYPKRMCKNLKELIKNEDMSRIGGYQHQLFSPGNI